ncbi:hypothetical protein FGO68_gene8804 [Halteria grandinella]|uniref:Uncharacterized protein n=1 Tax=Halteria grandinella TaxID=5974 RepID=A0A8J8NNC7_HALGN|nr:hypothetical protein FGO68_gene8804 [Halteria grandinella]
MSALVQSNQFRDQTSIIQKILRSNIIKFPQEQMRFLDVRAFRNKIIEKARNGLNTVRRSGKSIRRVIRRTGRRVEEMFREDSDDEEEAKQLQAPQRDAQQNEAAIINEGGDDQIFMRNSMDNNQPLLRISLSEENGLREVVCQPSSSPIQWAAARVLDLTRLVGATGVSFGTIRTALQSTLRSTTSLIHNRGSLSALQLIPHLKSAFFAAFICSIAPIATDTVTNTVLPWLQQVLQPIFDRYNVQVDMNAFLSDKVAVSLHLATIAGTVGASIAIGRNLAGLPGAAIGGVVGIGAHVYYRWSAFNRSEDNGA